MNSYIKGLYATHNEMKSIILKEPKQSLEFKVYFRQIEDLLHEYEVNECVSEEELARNG